MKALVPLILVLFGLTAGAGAGWFLRPPAPETGNTQSPSDNGADRRGPTQGQAQDSTEREARRRTAAAETGKRETLKLPNQFLVPLVSEDRLRAVVVIGLALELSEGHDVSLARQEARLRAGFLQALFDHANMGGFEGIFTSGEVLLSLRRQLRDIAREQLGDAVHDVLITELMRQDNT